MVEAGVRGFKCFLIESGVEVCDVITYLKVAGRTSLYDRSFPA